MKCLVVITASLLVGLVSTSAHGQEDTDVLLGAIAGGVIGSTIGDGDGQKIATALGALIGADMARNNSNNYYRSERSFRSWCRKNVPAAYVRNAGAANAWINGCVDRLSQEQANLEQQAYAEGANLDN